MFKRFSILSYLVLAVFLISFSAKADLTAEQIQALRAEFKQSNTEDAKNQNNRALVEALKKSQVLLSILEEDENLDQAPILAALQLPASALNDSEWKEVRFFLLTHIELDRMREAFHMNTELAEAAAKYSNNLKVRMKTDLDKKKKKLDEHIHTAALLKVVTLGMALKSTVAPTQSPAAQAKQKRPTTVKERLQARVKAKQEESLSPANINEQNKWAYQNIEREKREYAEEEARVNSHNGVLDNAILFFHQKNPFEVAVFGDRNLNPSYYDLYNVIQAHARLIKAS